MPKISHLYKETQNLFDHDIRLWPTYAIPRVPTQKKSVDYRMYVCKYMKIVIQPHRGAELTDWQENMPKFRAKFAYAILCATRK
ncbi:hypothetical protein IEQ34_009361 [Dendrobium chrysotoxum]|uniref:Uncharacterized protein n=1 Tax=Dendrobium chrysotoxum TaxID=161865 RepID=A0AAV7GYF5_DENCH|nr:hypothetical protein IEQ34_009361 [Dendrobium chrysotoxum]